MQESCQNGQGDNNTGISNSPYFAPTQKYTRRGFPDCSPFALNGTGVTHREGPEDAPPPLFIFVGEQAGNNRKKVAFSRDAEVITNHIGQF